MVMSLIRPSWGLGFARNAVESANPHLWRGLVGAWCPNLGITGIGTDCLRDVSGFNNHGTSEASMTMADWVIGGRGNLVLDFDGTDDHLTIPHSPLFDFTDKIFSIVGWVNGRATDDYWIAKATQSTGWGAYLQDVAGAIQYRLFIQGATDTLSATTNVATNTWAHVAFTLHGSAGKVYINGKLDTTDANVLGTISDTSTRLTICADEADNLDFNSQIENTFLYNRAISYYEARQHYVDSFALFRLRPVLAKAPVVAGRIMSSLVASGGLVGQGGIAGQGGGLAK